MTAVDAWRALERAAECGPFFDLVRWDDDPPRTGEPGWLPMTEFADHPLGLASRVSTARESLVARGLHGARASPAAELRIAASVAFLGLAARLISPALGALVLAGVVPDLSWQRLYWRPAAVGLLPLGSGRIAGRLVRPANYEAGSGPSSGSGSGFGSSTGTGTGSGSGSGFASDADSDDAGLVLGTTIAPVLRLGDVVAERFGVPAGVVAGNVASALVGAVQAATWTCPSAADAGIPLMNALLGSRELAGTGRFLEPARGDQRTRFRRRSCCLLYRVDGAGLCGDCVLHDHPGTGDVRR